MRATVYGGNLGNILDDEHFKLLRLYFRAKKKFLKLLKSAKNS